MIESCLPRKRTRFEIEAELAERKKELAKKKAIQKFAKLKSNRKKKNK